MRVIIAGCRDFDNYEFLKTLCGFSLLGIEEKVTVISGHAKGADMLGEKFAIEHGLSLEIYPADWKKYGPSAGPIRNEKMAKIADMLIAF